MRASETKNLEEEREANNRQNGPLSPTKVYTNEEITAAILKIEENLAKITKMIEEKKAKPDPDDAKVNELAKSRACLKDFSLYS